jgi:predicted membrane-bound spermidine synthase
MATMPVVFLLFYNTFILCAAFAEKRCNRQNFVLPTVLFFCSGMPALIYQIVWQRTLFAIYGVNSESVAVVVTAFMVGLGLGSLLGGWLSMKFPHRAILLFGVAEFSVALFGLLSLRIFHWAAAYTAGAPLPSVVFLSLALLLFPTVCMGTTLPLLADHLVRSSKTVGYSVGILYFANTFGSAFACYLCATFLLRDFGQASSVRIAVGLNVVIAATAIFVGRSKGRSSSSPPHVSSSVVPQNPALSLHLAMGLAAIIGFISLGFEIIWFRVFVLASSDRAPAFALLLSTYLAGVAAGSFIAGKHTENKSPKQIVFGVAIVILLAGGISPYLAPLTAWLTSHGVSFLLAAPVFFLVAALLGSVFTLVCKLAVPVGPGAGRGVSLIYISNIVGSACGSLLVGFVLMNHFGLLQVTSQLGITAFLVGIIVLLLARVRLQLSGVGSIVVPAAAFVALLFAPTLFPGVHEKLVFNAGAAAVGRLAHLVENRNGVIAVTQDDAVFGSGVYDGYFNIDPVKDMNLIVRAFALSAFHPAPTRILMIGLSSGSWAQVLVNNPGVQSLEVVEINPGYLNLIPQYPEVASLITNPKVQIHIDDGRRWLLSHSNTRYDVIVQNTSFYWRDHTSELLSSDYLRIIRSHLKPGGTFYYNTTGSDDVIATGLSVFPFGLRVFNFLAVSDSPILVDKHRWAEVLGRYSIDGRVVFEPANPAASDILAKYMVLADSVSRPQVDNGMENSESIRARIKNPLIITDDNMGWEWRSIPAKP